MKKSLFKKLLFIFQFTSSVNKIESAGTGNRASKVESQKCNAPFELYLRSKISKLLKKKYFFKYFYIPSNVLLMPS
jgi:hypothetical protein